MPTPVPSDPLATLLLTEIATIDQLMRLRLSRALPRGMELSHYLVLNHLATTRAERTPAELARILHVSRGAMTNTLNRLERAGFVSIRPDWDDARRKLVTLLPAGAQACNEAGKAVAAVVAETVQALGRERIREILPALRDLRQLLEAEEGGRAGAALSRGAGPSSRS